MRKFRKITPTIEAYKFDGDVNKLVEFLGEENVLIRPNTGAVFIASSIHGHEFLPEGFYVVKNDKSHAIYEPNQFEAGFEPIETFITSININCSLSDNELEKIVEEMSKTRAVILAKGEFLWT